MTALHIPKYLKERTQVSSNEASLFQKKYVEKLKSSINQIYNQKAATLSYQELYSEGYRVCLHKGGPHVYSAVQDILQYHVKKLRRDIDMFRDEEFLRELLKQWQRHRAAVGMVRDILLFMERSYISQSNNKSIYAYGVELFGKEMFESRETLEKVQDLTMTLINSARCGEKLDEYFLLKDIVQMMLEIDRKDIYERYFERRFLQETKQFYTKEAQDLFESSSVSDYLKKVQQRLSEEKDRSKRCMHPSTGEKLDLIIKDCMISKYKNLIIDKEQTGCRSMLESWRLDDIRLVYKVLGTVKNALYPLLKLVGKYFREKATIISEEKNSAPIELIQCLMALKQRSEELLEYAVAQRNYGIFSRDPHFAIEVKEAWDEIVNKDDQFSEYLSLFLDQKLKKGKNGVTESEFDTLFDQVISLYRHITDKDVFERYYKAHLARRLLSDSSQSDDAEKNFLAKLKIEFGAHVTRKLEGMFGDMKKSKELTSEFKHYMRNQEAAKSEKYVDLHANILTTGYWPTFRLIDIPIPKQIEPTRELFESFYSEKHDGRQLNWLFIVGTADIRANGFPQRYELIVSPLQMVILVLFNDYEKLSFNDLQKKTNIPDAELKKQLISLCRKAKNHLPILECDSLTSLKDSEIRPNNSFRSSLLRCKIAPVVVKQTQEESKETKQNIDEERKWLLDAAIVRILKARKEITHQQLLIEVVKHLQSRFIPSPDMVKRRIESLIEREYMHRLPHNASVYEYLA